MRFIKMTGGLGNQMFIYAFYMRMKKHYSNTRIDLSDMVHYKAHNGYEMHRVFNLPPIEFRINQPLKKVIEFLFFKKIYERKQVPSSLVPYDKKAMETFYTKYHFHKLTYKKACLLYTLDVYKRQIM